MSAIVEKIEGILTSAYTVENYVALTTEVFDRMKVVAPSFLRKDFPTNFAAHIVGYSHVGSYESPDAKSIIILSVELKKQLYVENSRSTQRSLAKKLIENANADAALIAFYTKDDPRWRLSFVRLDYEMKIENGKMKAAENLTPARRYSFLVGQDEPCHTAIERFRLFLEKHNAYPTLDDLETAFSVEAVTKEFFELYCEKYHQLREALERNADFTEEAKLHNFTSAQFAKKLMGQIVFLYFLQKKGWLGVKAWPRQLNAADYKKAYYSRGTKSRELIPTVYTQVDSDTYRINAPALNALSDDDETFLSTCVRGEPWGTGPHNFMRKLFELSEKRGENFFDAYLEPLFYDALNVNRGEQGYDPALHCRIPFLSGGLFEPLDGYDWEHNNFAVPNELFSNKKDHKDRLADGILDIFDRYNFTMSEDEPLEREVAIDPEMLGKVFENLLDVNDRKSKGAFYTPREIVHYMCQESLINYLTNTMHVSEMAIRDFILYGDFMKDEDASVLRRAESGESYELWISEELYQLGKDGRIVVDRIAELDKALQDVRVADPAVGSGAFPLGMLNEIVRARQNLTTYMDLTQKIRDPKGAAREIRYRRINERSARQLKYETIRNCIFAVDIEPSAVDIAQLRLWLALVIDDEIDPSAVSALDGHRNPLPLPNLECNILCGNSLIDEFEGIKLINQSDIIGTAAGGLQTNLYQSGFEANLQRLIEKQDELFKCDNTEKKKIILQDIDALRDNVIMSQIQDADPSTIDRYYETKGLASKPFVLWQLDFARVYREKGGFDIVLGNPPYVDSEVMTKTMPGTRELYCKLFFCAKGNWDLFVLFIEKGLSLLKNQGIISYIIPNKLISAPYAAAIREKMAENNIIELRDYSSVSVFETAAVYPVVFRVQRNSPKGNVIMDVMESVLHVAKHNLITKEQFYKDNEWDKYFSSSQEELQIIELMNQFPKLKALANINGAATVGEAYLIKELLFDGDSSIKGAKKFINTGGIDPYISLHGKTPIRYLKSSYVYPLVNNEALKNMSEKRYIESNSCKIIIGGMTKRLECYYDSGEYLAGKSTTIVYNNPMLKYFTALLNSRLMTFYYSCTFNSMSLAGGFYRIGAPQVKELPIAIPKDVEIIKEIETMVDIMQSNSCSDEEFEKNLAVLDDYICDAYGLDEEQRAVVYQWKGK